MQNLKLELYEKKKFHSKTEIAKKLFTITQVLFYKREKEARECLLLVRFYFSSWKFRFFLNKFKKEQYGDIH